MLRTSQIVAGILLVPYVACGVVLCILVLDRKHCNSPYYFPNNNNPHYFFGRTYMPLVEDNGAALEPEQSHEDRFCAGGYHGLLSLMGTLLIGFTIIIYRLLTGIRTRIVKYVHLILHVMTLIVFSTGLWCIFIHENSITYDSINYHAVTSWVVFWIFCAQLVVATIIYAYHYPNTKLRLYFAPFHDIIGVWLFICCVACCISGRRRAQLDYVGINQELFYGLSYVCFTIILVIVLSPFFEWDMVGPL